MMQNKASRILRNAFLVGVAWILIGGLIWFILDKTNPAGGLSAEDMKELSANLRSLAATLSQIAATMAGFILAALALLLSLSERDLVKRMGASGHFHVLVIRMKMSLLLCLALTVIGVAMIVIPKLAPGHLYFLSAACAIVAFSILDILYKLLLVFFFLSPLPHSETDERARVLYEDSIG